MTSHNWHSSMSHARADPPYSGLMESTRQTWSDERMDEFARRSETGFSEVRGEIRDLRTEMNGRFGRLERRFDVMLGAMITGFVGLIISHFVG
jgi:hypothetical protein